MHHRHLSLFFSSIVFAAISINFKIFKQFKFEIRTSPSDSSSLEILASTIFFIRSTSLSSSSEESWSACWIPVVVCWNRRLMPAMDSPPSVKIAMLFSLLLYLCIFMFECPDFNHLNHSLLLLENLMSILLTEVAHEDGAVELHVCFVPLISPPLDV